MANVIVTLTSVVPNPPRLNEASLALGNNADTEQIAIGESSVTGNKAATAFRYVAVVKAAAECWVAIGSSPTAVAGSGWHFDASEMREFWMATGDKVAVIQA